MSRRTGVCLLAMLVWLTGCGAPLPADPVRAGGGVAAVAPADSSASLARGRAIYRSGTSPSGRPIQARLGQGPPVPASSLACVQCHGEDGRGKPEGGVNPSNITWPALTRPYGTTEAGGRRHPPYTPALLGRAITMGWDPAGQALAATMPRYELTQDDLNDLIRYIQSLGTDSGDEIIGDVLRIGVAACADAAEERTRVEALLAFADEVNRGGGIFRRRLEWVFLRPGESGFDPDEVFATLGGFSPDAGMSPSSVPTITVFAPIGTASPSTFALTSGHAGQARALADFLAGRPDGFRGKIALVHGASPRVNALARSLARQLGGRGAATVLIHPLPDPVGTPELVARLGDEDVSIVLLVGPVDSEELLAFAREMAWRDPRPAILAPGAIAGMLLAAPASKDLGALIVAWPILPGSDSVAGKEARAAATVLLEGLKGAGRSLDREKFVAAMETLSSVETGVTPPLTFGRSRRVGARGALIARVDPAAKTFEVLAPWIEPGPESDVWPDP